MIISLIKLIWPYKSSLTLPLFIEVPVPSHESEQLCICVLEVSILPVFLRLDFGSVPTEWYFLLV